MSENGRTAYITGGASGIGKATVQMLVEKGIKVCIADRDVKGAESLASELSKGGKTVTAVEVDVTSWDQQLKAFEKAITDLGGRVDYVFPIAGVGERRWLPKSSGSSGFQKPDLLCIEADLTGVLYTVALAVQQFRRQEKNEHGFRGKLCCVASVCGFYCVPTVPVYTAAKHGVVGMTRSYGKYLPEEGITMNSVCPNVLRTNISSGAFYEKIEKLGLLCDMKGLLQAFEAMMGNSKMSGECLEVSPEKVGFTTRAPAEALDQKTKDTLDQIYERSHPQVEP